MKKSLLSLSLVASVVLFSGCGSSSATDTTPPKFTNTTAMFNVDELKSKPIALVADEAVTFSENSADATISGNTLTFTAPAYRVGETNIYKVTVTAKDSAGNTSKKDFTFNVQNVITEDIKANASYVAPTGNKTFTNKDGFLQDGSGLLWKDVKDDAPELTYESADAYCKSVEGWRIPTRGEFLNLIDYNKGDNLAQKSLVDSDFTGFSSNSIDLSWVKEVGGKKFAVNHKSGADTEGGTDRNMTVMCVYGDSADTHVIDSTGSNIKDNTSKREWTKITNTTVGSGTYGKYSEAVAYCTNQGSGFGLPTINELRSIVDYKNNSVPMGTPTGLTSGNYYIWSSTAVTNTTNSKSQHYLIHLDGDTSKSGVTSDEDSNIVNGNELSTHYITCVKKI